MSAIVVRNLVRNALPSIQTATGGVGLSSQEVSMTLEHWRSTYTTLAQSYGSHRIVRGQIKEQLPRVLYWGVRCRFDRITLSMTGLMPEYDQHQ